MRPILFLTLFLLPFGTAHSQCSTNSILQTVFTSTGETVELEMVTANTQKMSKHLISEAQDGKKFSYWVDNQNQILFSDPHALTEAQTTLVLKDASSHEGFMIKEAGEFSFDPEKKKYVFNQKKAWDLEPGEIDAAIKEQTRLDFSRKADPRYDHARVMNCTNVLAAQQRADNFLLDSVVSSGVVTLSSFVTVEMISPGKKTLQEKGRLLASDLLANTISSAASSYVVKPLIMKKAGIITDFTQRTATDFGTNFLIKKPIYNLLNPAKENDADQKKRTLGNKLVYYDTAFSVVRFLPKRAIERATVYTLPKLMIESCLKNSALHFVIGPRTVRIVDRYAWGLAYMGGRKVYLNQFDEEKKK